MGILAEAKARGLIPLCAPVLDEMIEVAGFWIGEGLSADDSRKLGEIDWKTPHCDKLVVVWNWAARLGSQVDATQHPPWHSPTTER